MLLKIKTLVELLLLMILYSTLANAQSNLKDTLLITSNFIATESSVHQMKNNPEQKKEQQSFSTNILQRNNISGDWWNLRNTLSESGFDFDFVYKGEVFSNISGGLEQRITTLDNIDLIFSADLEKSLGFEKSSLVVQFLGNSGGVPCEFVGAVQGITNIETIPTWKLYQLMLDKKFFNEKISVAVGLYDLNSEFDCRETSSIFINPSHGIGPDFSHSGLNGPSIFPTTSLAIRLKYESENGSFFQTAILDGVPGNPENPYGTQIVFNREDGLLITAEYGLITTEDELLESKVAFGAWTYTSDFEKNNFLDNDNNLVSFEKNYGFYLTAEKLIASNSENQNKNITGFLRLGYANKNVNPVDFYFGTGLKFTALFSGREEDELGLAFALVHNSSAFIESSIKLEDVSIRPYEINLEATYILHLTPWFIIQPDIQYIINPSYCTTSESAFVVGSRVQLIF